MPVVLASNKAPKTDSAALSASTPSVLSTSAAKISGTSWSALEPAEASINAITPSYRIR